MNDECPWPECDKPWSKHDGIERIVHEENSIYKRPPKMKGMPDGCICPILQPTPGGCPIHGGG